MITKTNLIYSDTNEWHFPKIPLYTTNSSILDNIEINLK